MNSNRRSTKVLAYLSLFGSLFVNACGLYSKDGLFYALGSLFLILGLGLLNVDMRMARIEQKLYGDEK
jgi:hypothetical protein